MAAITAFSDFGAPKNKVSHCFHCFPIYLYEVMGLDAMILVFWMLSLKPTFSLSSFTEWERPRTLVSNTLYSVEIRLHVHVLTNFPILDAKCLKDWKGYLFALNLYDWSLCLAHGEYWKDIFLLEMNKKLSPVCNYWINCWFNNFSSTLLHGV